jgi:hypothetical protein
MAAAKLTRPANPKRFVDVCCKNVTAARPRRLDMYQLVSTIVLNSTRARAEAPLSVVIAGRRRRVGDFEACRGSHGT